MTTLIWKPVETLNGFAAHLPWDRHRKGPQGHSWNFLAFKSFSIPIHLCQLLWVSEEDEARGIVDSESLPHGSLKMELEGVGGLHPVPGVRSPVHLREFSEIVWRPHINVEDSWQNEVLDSFSFTHSLILAGTRTCKNPWHLYNTWKAPRTLTWSAQAS